MTCPHCGRSDRGRWPSSWTWHYEGCPNRPVMDTWRKNVLTIRIGRFALVINLVR